MIRIYRRPTLFFLSILLMATLACGLISGRSPATTPAPTQPSIQSAVATALAELPAVDDTPADNSSAPTTVEVPAHDQGVLLQNQPELEPTLMALYQQINPSVVHILVYTSVSDLTPLGTGSGFVYDQEGRIVTNNHVVQDGRVLEVVFTDGNRRRAEIVGRDVDSDLAVIQADSLPPGVQPLRLGDSNALQVGQFVVAIGNPFREAGSMTLGIISGLSRSLESQRPTEGSGTYSLPQVIQTDAPINPGNSGGPLLNLRGEVIGVNSAIRSETGFNSGVGFAIPVNAVKRIIPVLINDGEYVYPFIGVSILPSLNLNVQEALGLPQATGAYVRGVQPNSPASEAGLIAADNADLRGGDLIIGIDGRPVRDFNELISYLVFETEVGQTVQLTVIRSNQEITLPLTLGARP